MTHLPSKREYNPDELITEIMNSIPCYMVLIDENAGIKEMNASAKNQDKRASPAQNSLLELFQDLGALEGAFSDGPSIMSVGQIAYDAEGNSKCFSGILSMLEFKGEPCQSLFLNEDIGYAAKSAKRSFADDRLPLLGLLTTGIADKVNKLTDLIASQIEPLSNKFYTLIDILQTHLAVDSGDDLKKVLEMQGNHAIDYSDFDKIKETIVMLSQKNKHIIDIIKEIKAFLHQDSIPLEKMDMHKLADLIHMHLQSLVKGKIVLENNFESSPFMESCTGNLNHTFMVMLSKSIEAIFNKGGEEPQAITITTFAQDKNVYIKIKDTGPGISVSKTFAPFSIGRKVNENTYSSFIIMQMIIKAYGGRILFATKEGVDFECTIIIPLEKLLAPKC